MSERLPSSVYRRFQESLISGDPTAEEEPQLVEALKTSVVRGEDMKVIADMLFAWARERGAIDFSHWFFPLRGGGGR